MRILLLSNTLPPEGTATAGLISNLVSALCKKGVYIDALTVPKMKGESGKKTVGDLTVFYTESVPSMNKKKNWLFSKIRGLMKTLIPPTANLYNEDIVLSYLAKMVELKAYSYDCVIPVCGYYDVAEAVLRYKKNISGKIKLALYQVDPLMENASYATIADSKLFQYEKELYECCDYVFTTPLIYNEKRQIGWDTEHVIPIEFPAVVSKEEVLPIAREDDEVRCVFAGYLYRKIRDPQYTLTLFSRLSPQIHLYILGTGNEKLLKQYADGPMKGRLHCLGMLPPDECDQWLSSADILVNIGNSVLNQVPSKLFQYISFGKCILNICKDRKCATRPYIEKYPLGFELVESNCIDRETVENTEKWMLEHMQERVEFPEISRIYASSTPEYVAEKILSCIKKEN